MRFIYIALFFLSSSAFADPPIVTTSLNCLTDPAQEIKKQHAEMLYPSVRVSTPKGTGSGSIIFSASYEDKIKTFVLTNHHVIAGSISVSKEWNPRTQKEEKVERRDTVTVETFDYNDLSRAVGTRGKKAKIVAYDANFDLALLELIDKESVLPNIVTLAPEERVLHIFEKAWAVGSGLGEPPFPTFGHLSNLDQRIEGNRYIFASTPIIFGNSGGQLFHVYECHYEMIGIPSRVRSSWGSGPVTHMAFAIPTETIYKFLRENRYHYIWGEEVPPKEEKKDGDDEEEGYVERAKSFESPPNDLPKE